MLAPDQRAEIRYAFPDKPAAGNTQPVVDGIHWLRMPLPFVLGHINLWLIDEGDQWTIVDTGVCVPDAQDVWENTFASTMDNRPAGRVIVTHLHPDHVGCAGWLTERFGVELWMSRAEYLLCRVLVADTGRAAPEEGTAFYAAAGFPAESMHSYQKMFGMFGKFVSPMPESYRRIADGDRITIGGDEWEVIEGRGHSPEHACLYNAAQNLLISGDQLLPTISSNVSVYPTEPLANPLTDWIESLQQLKNRIPADVLVLPAHGKPFYGAHERLDSLVEEHFSALDALHKLCAEPRRAVDVFPALFKAKITDKNLIMAAGEALAHLNYLMAEQRVSVTTDENGVRWYQSCA